MTNPLQKFFRQPKLYVSLPSKGLYYEPGALTGDYNAVPVFAMTGMDEIIYKTPDALFSGEATSKVIESCCPSIKNAKVMPNIDIEAVMIAIRIATFGESMSVNHICKNCQTENEYDINLTETLEHFNSLKFENNVRISEDLTVKIRPLQYEEMSYLSIENYKLQKMLTQIQDLDEKEKQKKIDEIYNNLSELQLQLFLTIIESVNAQEFHVEEKKHIEEWLRNTERTNYATIKQKLEENKEQWNSPKTNIKCSNCGTEDALQIVLDQSNFFV